jgi:hypothetical protein
VDYELLRIKNLFVPASSGVAQYNSLADFAARRPRQLRYANAVTNDPEDAAANWDNATWTAYAQDQIKLTNDLTLQAGLRYELYQTGDEITPNENFVERHGFDNTETLDGRGILMPRIGISWLPTNNINVRIGGGLYSGGTPSVWVSNNFTNDGVRTNSETVTSATPAGAMILQDFNGRDIPQALKDMVAAGNGNVDALDEDFEIPSVWKAGIGTDFSVDVPGAGDSGKNVEVKLNYTYSKTRYGVTWLDLRRDLESLPNNQPIGETVDGRPLYPAAFNPRRGYDMLLTNSRQGEGHVASVLVQKGFPFGLYVSGSYAYQDVTEVNPGTSSRAVSNYGLTAVTDPQFPDAAASNYERKHRFTAAVEYSQRIVGLFTDSAPWKNMKTSFGMFVESRSGQPYSWTFADANRGDTLARIFGEAIDFSSRNRQLFYVPKGDGSDVILTGITDAEMNAFLDRTGLSKYRGQIAPRNAFRSPWFHRFDVRLAQDLPNPISGHRARFAIDIENVGNLLNDNWGRSEAVGFPFTAPAVNVAIDPATGKYEYSALRSYKATRVDVLQSVWRVGVGLMYDF